ncbi:precorrin-6y C5,15-methyltransferase (decarboxylating) subunit CbiE [Streptomyces violarus]|uniref:Precorrin-6Y C5,15-methyltransferase (Decarboxylating) n=1 Tax=Streptomyces violarus TaxID=67380 RepID=A0A7W4ZW32_9ACTN|nr:MULTISPECIES: precorrin-6y C5,15-methyltransferase (decarboxylating) subunit CbiE [Streptomyces]MBB3079721.1 precorrin-6Y C5,15-methyltransferase (decarboxylating) [Streptomyces violarus]WRU02435.1 precorrin-6y C5,15-methyltransferase (decarboxylating) subunit CbiE [Streptomyces sp. CGMCC 4.1772]GHD24548.1 precorrin-6y C5,15-methyltransferase (decarboxylating) subunit CbiE [Streptomyces violarus]
MADRVTVIGWDGSPLTDAARAALGAATLVAGAAHHLALPEVPAGAERIRLGSVALAARRIAGHRGTAVVLADGDPGYFGVVRTLRAPEFGLEVEVVPAVSSVAAAFARAGMPWDDAQVVVAHRRTLRRAVNVCRAHTKVAVLTSPGAGPAELGLLLEGVHRSFVICEELGTERERVTIVTSDKAADHAWRDPNVVIVLGGPAGPGTAGEAGGWIAGRDPSAGPRGWSLPAEAYGAHLGEGETQPLRASQLARLGPRVGDLVWDIGCGSGAFAVEAARAGAAVIAVDSDRAACARTDATARRLGVQLQIVHGTAPHILENLPEPDVVRVGAGGAPVVSAVADRRPQRIVTHAGTRDAAELIGRDLTEHGYGVECALLQSVELDTRAWTEKERSVAFLLSGVLPRRSA